MWRCQTRPIAHVAAEMGISRQCAGKWVNRYRCFGEAGLLDRPSVPHHQPPLPDGSGGPVKFSRADVSRT